jgi:hypothetical protein
MPPHLVPDVQSWPRSCAARHGPQVGDVGRVTNTEVTFPTPAASGKWQSLPRRVIMGGMGAPGAGCSGRGAFNGRTTAAHALSSR